MTFRCSWIFMGEPLPVNLHRVMGIGPQEFCGLDPGLFLAAPLTVDATEEKPGETSEVVSQCQRGRSYRG